MLYYYSTLLYSTLLDSTRLYSTLLYSTLLYSTLLYSTAPLTSAEPRRAEHAGPPQDSGQEQTQAACGARTPSSTAFGRHTPPFSHAGWQDAASMLTRRACRAPSAPEPRPAATASHRAARGGFIFGARPSAAAGSSVCPLPRCRAWAFACASAAGGGGEGGPGARKGGASPLGHGRRSRSLSRALLRSSSPSFWQPQYSQEVLSSRIRL